MYQKQKQATIRATELTRGTSGGSGVHLPPGTVKCAVIACVHSKRQQHKALSKLQ